MKYPKICELVTQHGARVGRSYINKNAGKGVIYATLQSKKDRS